MSQAGNGLTQSVSDILGGVIPGQSCHAELVSSPPDYVRKISKYLESSGKQGGHCEAPNETSSDSGDSLFITQKPVPEAVRPKRRSSTHFSLRDLADEDDASSSSSDWESRTSKKKKVVYRLPTFTFPFLQEGKSSQKRNVSAHRNKKLHHFAMGGFFKCVQEDQECGQNRNLVASLPTIDREGEYIAPISEQKEEGSTEAEDIQVVERKRFVVSLKPKTYQPWYEPRQTCSVDKRQPEGAQTSGSESQSQKQRMEEEAAAGRRLFCSRAKSCNEGDSSHESMRDGLARDMSSMQTERADKSLKRKLKLIPNGNGKHLCDDSDSTVCDADADKGFGTLTEPCKQSAESEREGPDLLQNNTAEDWLCEGIKKKKRKNRKKCKEYPSLEEAEFVEISEKENGDLPKDTSESADLNQNTLSITYADHQIEPEVNAEKRKKKKQRKQKEQLQTAAEPQTENEEADKCLDGVSDLQGSSENVETPLETSVKRKKNKKKKRLSSVNDSRVEDSCIDVEVSNDFSTSESMGTSAQKKINASCSPETQTMTGQMVTKKKKKKRETLSDDTNAQCESARKKDVRRASSSHQQEQAGPDSEGKPAGWTSDVAAISAEMPASSEERDTRRKKKKRSAAQLNEDRDSKKLRETCQSSASAVMKKRKLTESSESAADAEPAQTQQGDMPGKKKKNINNTFQHSNI